jgi:hypothetical protein
MHGTIRPRLHSNDGLRLNTSQYVYDVETSQEVRLWAAPAFYGIALLITCRCCSYLTGNTYGPPRPIMAIALLFYIMFLPHRKHTYGPPWPVTGIALLLYVLVDDVHTSKETHLWSYTGCYRHSFTFLYVDNVTTSQQTQTSTACYGDSFTVLYVYNDLTSQEGHLCASRACCCDSCTFLYADVRTSEETQVSTAWYGDRFFFMCRLCNTAQETPATTICYGDIFICT